MKPNCKRTLSKLLILGLTAATVLAPATTDMASAAAKKVKLSKKSVSVKVKGKATITVKNAGKKKVKAKMANKKIATVKVSKKKLTITGKKAGKTKLTVTVKGMKKCKITVTVKKASKKKTENKSNAGTSKQVTTTSTPAVSNSPEKKVTKLEWIRDLVDKTGLRVLKEEDIAVKGADTKIYSFQDIEETRDNLIVETAVRDGIITDAEIEKSNKKFNPDVVIEKEYVYTTALRLLGYCTNNTCISTAELDKSTIYSKYVQIAINIGLAKSDTNGKYNVHDSISPKEEEKILSFVKEKYDLMYGKVVPKNNSVLAEQFNEDAVDTDAKYTIEQVGNNYIVILPSEDVKDLKVDDSFYLPPSSQCPDGISLIAKEIVQDGDATNIKSSKVTSVEQIYEKIDIQDNYEITEENFTPAKGVSVVTPQDEEVNSENVKKLETNSEESGSEIDLKVEGEIGVKINKPELIASLEMDGAELQAITVEVNQVTELNVKVTGEAGFEKELGEVTIPILKAAGVNAHFILTLKAQANGEATIDASLDTSIGVVYKDGELNRVCKSEYKSESNLKLNCEALLEFGIELSALEYKIFGYEIGGWAVIDVGIEGGIGLQATTNERTEAEISEAGVSANTVSCMEVKIYPILTVFVGRNEESLFRKVYDYFTNNEESIEWLIWHKDSAGSLVKKKHWEKLDAGEWHEVKHCIYDDEEEITGGGDKTINIDNNSNSVSLYLGYIIQEAIRSKENKYWVVFREGFRNGQLEMSSFDASGEPYVKWDGRTRRSNLVCGNQEARCNQFQFNGKEFVKRGTYGVLTDYAQDIIASNVNIYDSNGNLVFEANSFDS